MSEWTLKNEDVNFCKLRLSNNHGRILKSLQCSDYLNEMFIGVWNSTPLQERAVFVSVTGSVLRGKIASLCAELRTLWPNPDTSITKSLSESLPECLEQDLEVLLRPNPNSNLLHELGLIVVLAKHETFGPLEELSNLVLSIIRFVAKPTVTTADLVALFQSGMVSDRVGGGQGLLRGEKYVLSNLLYNHFEEELASFLWDRFGPGDYPSDIGGQEAVLYSLTRLLAIHMVIVEDKILENISILARISGSNRSHDGTMTAFDYRSKPQSLQEGSQSITGEIVLSITRTKSKVPSVVRVSQEHHKYFKLRTVLKSISPINLVESSAELALLGAFHSLNVCRANSLHNSETAIFWNFMAMNPAPTPPTMAYWNQFMKTSLEERNYHMNYDDVENRRRIVATQGENLHGSHGYYSGTSQTGSYHQSYSQAGSQSGSRHNQGNHRQGYGNQGPRNDKHRNHKSGQKDLGQLNLPSGSQSPLKLADGEPDSMLYQEITPGKPQRSGMQFSDHLPGSMSYARQGNGYQIKRVPQHRGSAEGFYTTQAQSNNQNRHYPKLHVEVYPSTEDADMTPTSAHKITEVPERSRGYTNLGKPMQLKLGTDKHRVRFESSNDQELGYMRAQRYENMPKRNDREGLEPPQQQTTRRLSSKDDHSSDMHFVGSAGKKKVLKATSSSYFGPDDPSKAKPGNLLQNDKFGTDAGETNVSLNLEELDFSNLDKKSSGWTQNRKNDSNLFTIEDKESLAHKNSGLDYSENASLLYLMQIPLRQDEHPGSKQSLNSSGMSKDLSGYMLNSPRTDTSRNGKVVITDGDGNQLRMVIDQNKSMPDETCSRKESRSECLDKGPLLTDQGVTGGVDDLRILQAQQNLEENQVEGERRDTGIPAFMAHKFDIVGAVTTESEAEKTTLYTAHSGPVRPASRLDSSDRLEETVQSIPGWTQEGGPTTDGRYTHSSKKGSAFAAFKDRRAGYTPKEDRSNDFQPKKPDRREFQKPAKDDNWAGWVDDTNDYPTQTSGLKSNYTKKQPNTQPSSRPSQQKPKKATKVEPVKEPSPDKFDKDAFPSLQEVAPKLEGLNPIEEAMQKQVALKAAQLAAATALAKEAAESKDTKDGRKKKPRTGPNYEKNPRRNTKY